MATRSCPHCGHIIPDVARFCGRCGQSSEPATVAAAPAAPAPSPLAEGFLNEAPTRTDWSPDPDVLAAMSEPAERKPAMKTALGMPAPSGLGAAPMPAPSGTAPAQAQEPPRQRTMLGVAMPGIAPEGPAPTPEKKPMGTLLGVAMPGVAPSPAGAAPQQAASPAVAARSSGRTLLGVSGPPNVAPPNAALPPDMLAPGVLTAQFRVPDILPAPAPPPREALPEAPELQKKRGIPMAPVVGAVAFVLAVGGGVLFFTMKSAAPLTAQGRVDEAGKEALAVKCPSCPDGTKLTLRAASVEVKGGEAVVPLAEPLALGANEFQVAIDRPAGGRDETVKLSVPVSYRVRADLSALSAEAPAFSVKVEAVPGATVEIDGKAVALAGGKADVPFPIGDAAIGTADESKVVERTVPFKVTLPGGSAAESGSLPVRVRIVPLHLDAPGSNAVIAAGPCKLTGQTVVGGKITVSGRDVTLGSRGEFSAESPCAETGKNEIPVVASIAGFASRRAVVVVTRVASLEAEGRAWEAKPTVPMEALTRPESVGKPTIVEGEIVDARIVNGLTIAVVDNRRSCKAQACLVRVLYGGPETLAKGQVVKAYGVVTKTVTADGKTVPEVDAAFVERKPK